MEQVFADVAHSAAAAQIVVRILRMRMVLMRMMTRMTMMMMMMSGYPDESLQKTVAVASVGVHAVAVSEALAPRF